MKFLIFIIVSIVLVAIRPHSAAPYGANHDQDPSYGDNYNPNYGNRNPPMDGYNYNPNYGNRNPPMDGYNYNPNYGIRYPPIYHENYNPNNGFYPPNSGTNNPGYPVQRRSGIGPDAQFDWMKSLGTSFKTASGNDEFGIKSEGQVETTFGIYKF